MENCITISAAAQRLDRSRSRIDQVLRELDIEPGWVGSTRFLTAVQFEQVSARIATPCKPGPKGRRQVFGGASEYASAYQIAESDADSYLAETDR